MISCSVFHFPYSSTTGGLCFLLEGVAWGNGKGRPSTRVRGLELCDVFFFLNRRAVEAPPVRGRKGETSGVPTENRCVHACFLVFLKRSLCLQQKCACAFCRVFLEQKHLGADLSTHSERTPVSPQRSWVISSVMGGIASYLCTLGPHCMRYMLGT